MEIVEYGKKENPKMLLIHGLQNPSSIWEEYVKVYEKNYFVIVPKLSGHNENKKEEFVSLDRDVKVLEKYFVKNNITKLDVVYGMSIGGVLAIKLLARNKVQIEKLILESTPLAGYNKLMQKLLAIPYKYLAKKVKERDENVIEKSIGSIIRKENLEDFLKVIDHMTDKTIDRYIAECGEFKMPEKINENTKIIYFHGTKLNEQLSKQSVKILKKYSNVTICLIEGKGHCEDSILHPKVMLKRLKKII